MIGRELNLLADTNQGLEYAHIVDSQLLGMLLGSDGSIDIVLFEAGRFVLLV